MNQSKRFSFRKINELIEEIGTEGVDYAPEVDPATGEVLTHVITSEDDIAEALDELEMQREEKVENIGRLCQKLEAKAKEIDTEIKRLTGWSKAMKHRASWLKHYCLEEMKRAGITKVTGKFVRVSVRKSPVSASIATDMDGRPDTTVLDAAYVHELTSHKVDKIGAISDYRNALKKHLEGGGTADDFEFEIDGFEFNTDNTHLHIA